MKRRLSWCCRVLVILTLVSVYFILTSSTAYANVAVNSFGVSPATLHSGDTSLFFWTGTGNGYTLMFECPEKVHAQSFDGSASPCGASRMLSSSVTVIGYTFTNQSSSTKTVQAFLYPKDATGKEYSAAVASTSLTITPAPPTLESPIVPAISLPIPRATSSTTTTTTIGATATASTTASSTTVTTAVATTSSTTIKTITFPLKKQLATTTAPIPSTKRVFTKTLVRGIRHDEVSTLQKLLASIPGIYPDNMVTGYFGVLTEKAVQRFQEKYDIAHSGDEGFGMVGPKTRAVLNAQITN